MKPAIHRCNDAESVGQNAATLVIDALAAKPNLLLCAASGSSPARTYQLLGEHCARKPDGFRALRLIKLDEWGGLDLQDPGTCENQLQTLLITPLGITNERYLGFHSNPNDAQVECERIRKRLASEGPIDLCILGLGMNGHIAMNEPASTLQADAHVAELAESTLQHPMLANSGSRPTFGLTLGIAEILASRQILLLVSGAKKRQPLQKLLQPEITTHFPASLLWLHPHWTLLYDLEASPS